MGTKSIRHIVETAVSTYLTAQAEFAGIQISTGDSADVQSLPRIICYCPSASPPPDLPEGLGNFLAQVEVHVMSSADDTNLTTHRARCAAVAGYMDSVTDLGAVFTSQGDAHLYDITPNAEADDHESRIWHTTLSFGVLCVLPA
jgi:hypothetical protein